MKVKVGKESQEMITLSRELFVTLFLDALIQLGADRVVNVRMQVSESLASHHNKLGDNSYILSIKQLQALVERMKSDRSQDVKDPLESITFPADSTTEQQPVGIELLSSGLQSQSTEEESKTEQV